MRYNVAISKSRAKSPAAATVSPSMDDGRWLGILYMVMDGMVVPFGMQQFDTREAALDDANGKLKVTSVDWVEVEENELEGFLRANTLSAAQPILASDSVTEISSKPGSGAARQGRSQKLPESQDSLMLRTDFADDAAWVSFRVALEVPSAEGFQAFVSCVSDPSFDGLTIDELVRLAAVEDGRSFVFIVDQLTLSDPEMPILVVDLNEEPGRNFRVIPSELWNVENNLSISNCDFSDFADCVDEDGVFRGYPEN